MTIQKGKPEQLKMFMSAHEIMQSHAPNEPDRNWLGTRFSVREAIGGAYVREQTARFGELTRRPVRTDEGLNYMDERDPSGKTFLRAPKRTKAPAETDEQLYSRKLDEAKYRDPVTMGVGVPTLFGSIRKEGVKTPIALGTTESPSGRPSIAGGHHRLAVMAHINPHQLLPVMHVQDVREAKRLKL